jgi:hypothetical protein
MSEFIVSVSVKRKTVNKEEGTELWVANTGDKVFEAPSEEALRETVRMHLLGVACSTLKKPVEQLTAKLTRTWRVCVVENESVDDDLVWDLFA